MMFFIGLGNPGETYKNNRHNVGHLFADYVKKNQGKKSNAFVKTSVFMNQSGPAVKKLLQSREVAVKDLVIVHDDLDIPFGKFKIQKGTGPQLHNGIGSIERSLKRKDFWRIRIGIDNRDPERPVDGETYVLQDFTHEELQKLPEIFEKISARLSSFTFEL